MRKYLIFGSNAIFVSLMKIHLVLISTKKLTGFLHYISLIMRDMWFYSYSHIAQNYFESDLYFFGLDNLLDYYNLMYN